MDSTENIKLTTNKQFDLPCIIVDKSGRVIALNNEVRKIINQVHPQVNFFELFDEQNLLTLQRIFIDARKYEITTKEIIGLKSGDEIKNYEVTFSPLKSENNIYFIICFSTPDGTKSKLDTQKFIIATNEIEKLVSDKRILSIVNKIKLTYPFTFIEKAKLQKEINELDLFFWVKDPNGKFILVNDFYANTLGFSANNLEGKNELDYLPKYLVTLYKTVNQYITETSNALILDSSSSPITSDLKKGNQIIQFPICDLENKTVAIIGFAQENVSTNQVESKVDLNKNFFRDLPVPILFVDNENKIIFSSSELLKLLLLPEELDVTQSELSKYFEKGFVKKLEDYLNDNSNKSTYNFTYTFEEKGNLTLEIEAEKIFDLEDIYLGARIVFTQKNELQIINESKARLYDSLLNNLPEAMFIYDIENLKFLEVNDAALKLYGYKRNDFLNMDLTDLYAPEDIQTLIQSSDSKTVRQGPWRHKKSDGTSILVELTRTLVEFKGKKGHLNIIKNVSDLVEEKKRNQVLQAVYEHTSDLIIITDKDGFILNANEQVSRKIGYSKKDLESRPFISLVTDDDRAKVNKNIFHSGLLKTTSLELEFKKPSGSFFKSIVIATPIKDFNGEIDSYSIILKPIEEKTESADVKKLNEGADNVDVPFLSHMFHELLTPINVILGFAQELWESIENPSDEQKEAVDIIKENQKLLLQIMDNAVEYSALQQKVVKFKPELIRFVDLINTLKENTSKFCDSKKVELQYGKISSSLSLESDKQKFVSLISLFIKIAVQITKESTVFLSASNIDENTILISIKDNKKAITPYLLKGLNDVFSDEESVIRRNYGFSRFSLRLTNRLIELLSAKKITVMKDGEAIEFGLTFPVKFTINEKASYELESVKPQVPETKLSLTESLEKPQVKPKFQELDLSQLSALYLEDQVDSQILFKNQMKDLKSIEFAPSFELALPLLKTKKFDFIVMDINLQGEYNGLDALRIIQKMPGYKDIPIIASTAYTQPGARENFIAAGFSDFIHKPLLRDKLIEILKRLLVK